jgi:hypothetical protein
LDGRPDVPREITYQMKNTTERLLFKGGVIAISNLPLGNLDFELDDLECVVVPDDVSLKLKSMLAELAIPMYSPGWSLERMVEESRKQQRRVKRQLSPPRKVKTRRPVRKPIARVT